MRIQPKQEDGSSAEQKAFEGKGRWQLACAGAALAVACVMLAVTCQQRNGHYQLAQEYVVAGEFSQAYEELARLPASYVAKEWLDRCVQLCLMDSTSSVDELKEALDELEQMWREADDVMKPAVKAGREALELRYQDKLYQTGLQELEQEQYQQSYDHLKLVPTYPHAEQLLWFLKAKLATLTDSASTKLNVVYSGLERIPEDYAGPCAQQIPALKAQVAELALQAQKREAEKRQASQQRKEALKASGIPYVGMPETQVNSTRQLGKAYTSNKGYGWAENEDGSRRGTEWKEYCWYRRSDGKIVFRADCKGGHVFRVVKYGGPLCWDGDKLLVKLGPQIRPTFGSGGISEDSSERPSGIRDDYDSPEDLYEENRDWLDDEDEAWDLWYDG